MNKIIKALSVIILFLLLFNNIASVDLTSIKNELKMDFKKTYSLINEDENTIQIACVGNSNLYSGFSPLDLWNDYGYTSTICASARQTIEESVHLMQKLLKKQQPKLVIIDSDMLFNHNPQIKNYCKKSYNINDFFLRTKLCFLKQDIENILSTLKNNNPHKQINTHGYKYNSKICKIEYRNYMLETDNLEEISSVNENQMDELINLCLENNAKILMIDIPSISSWNYERHNSVVKFANERSLDFLDFNLLYNEIGIDLTQCFRDKGRHLNYSGAKAITNYIGNYINENYSIENRKTNEKYKCWNDNYKSFMDYKLKFDK